MTRNAAIALPVRPKAAQAGRCSGCRRICPGYDAGAELRRWPVVSRPSATTRRAAISRAGNDEGEDDVSVARFCRVKEGVYTRPVAWVPLCPHACVNGPGDANPYRRANFQHCVPGISGRSWMVRNRRHPELSSVLVTQEQPVAGDSCHRQCHWKQWWTAAVGDDYEPVVTCGNSGGGVRYGGRSWFWIGLDGRGVKSMRRRRVCRPVSAGLLTRARPG